ncbi:hypothetical protein [Limnochorda pilosa]|uniref:Uncharacterized protein n=1 Tax=Limnochorda pilosa TaxID=1555112 RepID=A0A0K2SIU4_LIMPI|nr:hypothetical protein [Limnochorda pilosa]BAS27010.1 hypothetical protein LIP_1153 [Limnochorda pilosa]
MPRRRQAKAKEPADRYYQPVLRPWREDDRLVLADLLLDGHEPPAIARILNRYTSDVRRAIRTPETELVQRWLITSRFEARYPW